MKSIRIFTLFLLASTLNAYSLAHEEIRTAIRESEPIQMQHLLSTYKALSDKQQKSLIAFAKDIIKLRLQEQKKKDQSFITRPGGIYRALAYGLGTAGLWSTVIVLYATSIGKWNVLSPFNYGFALFSILTYPGAYLAWKQANKKDALWRTNKQKFYDALDVKSYLLENR